MVLLTGLNLQLILLLSHVTLRSTEPSFPCVRGLMEIVSCGAQCSSGSGFSDDSSGLGVPICSSPSVARQAPVDFIIPLQISQQCSHLQNNVNFLNCIHGLLWTDFSASTDISPTNTTAFPNIQPFPVTASFEIPPSLWDRDFVSYTALPCSFLISRMKYLPFSCHLFFPWNFTEQNFPSAMYQI